MNVLAVDVGGTSIKAALVSSDGTIVERHRRPTEASRGQAHVIARILDFVTELAEGAAAVGLVFPGLVDDAKGVGVYSANIGWRDVPFLDLLRERLDQPVAVGHDVRAGGLAESVLGAGRNAGDFLFLPIGTGIAGALILRDEPYSGARGFSGEIGHMPVWPDGERCACGQRGCLETYASAAAIIRRYGSPGLSAEDIAARSDAKAVQVWEEAVDALSIALTTYTALLDPELVVIGGGLGDCGQALLTPLRARLAERMTLREPPRLDVAALGSWAAVHGAAIMAWRALE